MHLNKANNRKQLEGKPCKWCLEDQHQETALSSRIARIAVPSDDFWKLALRAPNTADLQSPAHQSCDKARGLCSLC